MVKMPEEIKKSRKRKQEVDVSRFMPLLQEALTAFGVDVRYAVEMSKAAGTIERKREVCKSRAEIRLAEKAAKAECEKLEFRCDVDNPCGTGACRFASKNLAKILVEKNGEIERPNNSTRLSYSIEPVVVEYTNIKRRSSARRAIE